MQSVVFWTALPFLIPQALWLKRSAPRFEAAAGPETGVTGSGKTYRLVAVGDSIVSGVGARTLEGALVGQTAAALAVDLGGRVQWRARGSIGATSEKVLRKVLPRLPEGEADVVLLSVGVNDVTALTTLPTWRCNLGALLVELRRRHPSATLAVIGIPPLGGFPLLPQPLRALFGLRGRAFDQAAAQEAAQHPGALHVPLVFDPLPERFSPDGFHPSEDSYAELGQILAEALVPRLAEAG